MLVTAGFIALFAVLTPFSDRALHTLEEIPESSHLSLIQALMVPSWYAWPVLFVQSKLLHGLRAVRRRLTRV